MINANELRIGNWVSAPHSFVKIEKFINGGVHFTDGCGGNFESLDPIPLTPEILVKAGFIKCSPETSPNVGVDMDKSYISPFARTRLVLSFDDNGPDQINTYWIENVGMGEVSLTFDIKYVHQLQNLFYTLFDEELDIKM